MLVDSHCHLDQFENPAEVIATAAAEGVERVIAVGMHVVDFQKTIDLAGTLPGVYPALGIHPEEVQDYASIETELDRWVAFIRNATPRLVAIAEIGSGSPFCE